MAALPSLLDAGLTEWLKYEREALPQSPRKLGAYSAQVCEALQWPFFFDLPQTNAALQLHRADWLHWFGSLTLSEYRDPPGQPATSRLTTNFSPFGSRSFRTQSEYTPDAS